MAGQNQPPWQSYDEQGEPGRAISWEEARLGMLHGASHVWIWRIMHGKVEILVQRRSSTKATWSGQLDISAAGHIDAGETPVLAAIRETREEIGLELNESLLLLVGVYRAHLETEIDGKRIIENEFQWLYLTRLDETDQAIVVDKHEVDAVYWLSYDEFKEMVDGRGDDAIVPHGKAYYAMLLEALDQHANL